MCSHQPCVQQLSIIVIMLSLQKESGGEVSAASVQHSAWAPLCRRSSGSPALPPPGRQQAVPTVLPAATAPGTRWILVMNRLHILQVTSSSSVHDAVHFHLGESVIQARLKPKWEAIKNICPTTHRFLVGAYQNNSAEADDPSRYVCARMGLSLQLLPCCSQTPGQTGHLCLLTDNIVQPWAK